MDPKIVEKPPKKFSRILWRRPRSKMGCGAKERRRRLGGYGLKASDSG